MQIKLGSNHLGDSRAVASGGLQLSLNRLVCICQPVFTNTLLGTPQNETPNFLDPFVFVIVFFAN